MKTITKAIASTIEPTIVISSSNERPITVIDSAFTLGQHTVSIELNIPKLKNLIAEYFIARINESASAVIDETIQSLVRSNEFLALQLEHARGNIPDDEFENLVNKHLVAVQSIHPEDVAEKLKILYSVLSRPLDSETIASIFNCDITIVEMAVNTLMNEFRKV